MKPDIDALMEHLSGCREEPDTQDISEAFDKRLLGRVSRPDTLEQLAKVDSIKAVAEQMSQEARKALEPLVAKRQELDRAVLGLWHEIQKELPDAADAELFYVEQETHDVYQLTPKQQQDTYDKKLN